MTDHDPTRITNRPREVLVCEMDAARAVLGSLYSDVRAEADGAFEWGAQIADLGPITVTREACNAAVSLEGTTEVHVLVLSARNVVHVSAAGDRAEIVSGRAGALVSPGARFAWRSPAEIQILTMRMDAGFLAAQLEALTGDVVRGPIEFALELRIDAGAGAFVERLGHFIAGEIDRGTSLDHPVLLTSLHEALARAILTGQPHSHAHLLKKPPPSSEMVVRLVEEYADAHAEAAIRASDLVALTGAGMASIEAAFRAHRGTTPEGFLRARRLERARHTLLSEPHISLTRIAHAAGFLRPETFEANYFKTFRETPGETRRRGLIALPSPPDVAHRDAIEDRLAQLSPRERDVFVRVARGMLNKQIAGDLGITERMVREHRGRMMKKLGVASAAELGRFFERLGE